MTMDDSGLGEFLDALDLYGAQTERWPQAEREQAQILIARSPQARAQWQAMERAERALLRTRTVCDATDGGMTARILRLRQDNPRRHAARRASWAVAASFAVIAGLYVGAAPQPSDNPEDIVVAALAPSGGHDAW
jgi:hypothetical protein